jgi:uncharacterized membrane protein
MTWGHPHAWLILVAILLLAGFVRHFFNLRHRGRTAWWIPAVAAAGTLLLAIAIAPRPSGATTEVPPFAQVQRIVALRCAGCHAAHPTEAGFAVAPKGVQLDTPEGIRAHAAAIEAQAVRTRAMPLGNLTHMTDAERAMLGAWVAAGAPLR